MKSSLWMDVHTHFQRARAPHTHTHTHTHSNHCYTETHFIFSVFVSISRPMSICVVSFLHFRLIFIIIRLITPFKQMYLFFVHFAEYLLLTLDDNLDEESTNFQKQKFSLSVLLSFLLDFLPITAWCCL